MIKSLKKTYKEAKSDGQENFACNLKAILKFLPESSVVAVMEAEYREMDEYLLTILRNTFKVLPFK